MASPVPKPTMQLPYRVLDLTDDRGNLAGLLLAQLGADVVAAEPPEGQRARRLAPFADDVPGPERSLIHRAYNRGKRSVVLNDPEQLDQLVAGADVVIENGALPVDVAAMGEANPQLVTVSITPFGETGPKAGWAATDLTLSASSGTMSLTGDGDRAPLRISVPLVWHFAALDAACAAMMALTERHRSGLGQHASVAAQASYISANQFRMTYALAGDDPGQRAAGAQWMGPILAQVLNPCADGFVAAPFLFGPVIGPFSVRLWNWVHSEGGCPDSFIEVDWIGMGLIIDDDPEAKETFDEATRLLGEFLVTKTKAEIAEAAVKHRLLATPVANTRDLLGSDHLHARDYWDDVDGHRHNGRFAVFSTTPVAPIGPPPELGQHTREIVSRGSGQEATLTSSGSTDEPPLAGLKVLDFSWALAGPGVTRILADAGATVIRLETEVRPDPIRGSRPFIGDSGGFEGSVSWHTINAGKLSFPMDIGSDEVRPVLEDLIQWADVAVESFSAGVLASHGLSPDRLLELNPSLVVLSSTLAGQTGPMRELSGFGTTGAAIAGIYPTTGWPDRDPAGPWGPYTDFPSPRFGVIAILAALDECRRSGRGQHIDLSQAEATMHLLAPAFLEDEVNGRVGMWRGNADLNMAPHGVYPVAGDDRWIAIACESDEQWSAFAALLGDALGNEPLASRLDRAEELDLAIGAWTTNQDGSELEQLLQVHGIAAHRVATADDVIADPQLLHRDYFTALDHPVHGQTWAERSGFDLQRTPATVTQPGPTFGQHLWEVLTEHLGYDEETASAWVATGALA